MENGRDKRDQTMLGMRVRGKWRRCKLACRTPAPTSQRPFSAMDAGGRGPA